MNIQKMNDKMIELEEKEHSALLTYRANEYDYQRGVTEGFRSCMELLGYKWMGQLDGGFRRDRQGR